MNWLYHFFFMKNDLLNESSVLINCLMKKFSLITMININVTKYVFVDESIAHKICDVMNIELIKLVKKRVIKAYNDRKNQIITHAIYSSMIIQRHIKSFSSMLITKLDQQVIILRKSWMRKHEISYHDKTYYKIHFWFLHSFWNEQRKKHFFSKEKFFWSIKMQNSRELDNKKKH
jgi:hypothetical protein